MRRFICRHPGMVLYFLMFATGAIVLRYGFDQHLFAAPRPGMDQYSILECALKLAKGELPAGQYRYSYAYTVFLAFLALLSGGKLWLLRLFQLAVASLIPGTVCRTARLCRSGRTAAFAAGLLCCGYAPLVLISLDFLRAAPLALAFVGMAYFMLAAEFHAKRGRERRSFGFALAAGGCGALCVLGRENFLAVVPFVPFAWCLRREWKLAAAFAAAFAAPLALTILFNGVVYRSFQLVPGNVGNILDFYGGGEGGAGNVRSVICSVPRHLLDMMSGFELDNSLSVYAHREIISPLRALCLPFNLLWILAAAGAVSGRNSRAVRLCALLTALYAASMLFFTVFYRFRIPAVPLLAVLAAQAFRGAARLYREKRFVPLALAALAGAALFALTRVDPDTRRPVSERADVAKILIHNRRAVEAEEHLDKMTRDGLDTREGRLLLAGMLIDDRRVAEAEEYLDRMERRGFDVRTGWLYLAQALDRDGDAEGAKRAFSRFRALPKSR